MMIRATLLAAFFSCAAASLSDAGEIIVGSKAGMNLLRKAQVVEHARGLANNNNNNGQDYSWLYSYSIKYLGCSSIVQMAQDGQGGNNNKGGQNQQQGQLFTQQLVRFALCPSNSCASCAGGGEYVVNLNDFADAYTEARMNKQEYECETIRESTCYCQNANDDQSCYNTCYTNAGRTDCIDLESEQDFEIQQFLQCQQLQNKNNNNNNNNNNNANSASSYSGYLYVTAYCASNGKDIFMGVFYDSGCTQKAPASLYSERMYGYTLPYSSKSIVTSDCLDCTQSQNNNNNGGNNNNNNNGLSQVCTESYAAAVKCEQGMNKTHPDTSGCDYVKTYLPKLSVASRSASTGASAGGAAVAFAWIFAVTTLLFGAYAYFLYRKIKRGAVQPATL